MASTYTWTAVGSGAWGDAANWADLTSPGAGTAPGTSDTASIVGPSYPAVAFDLIYGPAAAATLNTSGNIAFAGAATIGAWTATGYNYVDVLPGATIAVASATLNADMQIAGPGAALSVVGTLALGFGSLTLFDHAVLRAQGMTGGGSFYLDPTATAEIGGAGIATAGTLAVDAGTTLGFNGEIYAPVLDQGTILSTSDVLFYAPVTGTGAIVIGGTSASVVLNTSVAAGITIDFANASGTLYLPSSTADVVAATITGFQAGDVLDTNIPGITGVLYTATGADIGTLALTANGTTVETLTLAGNYAGDTFVTLSTPPTFGEALVMLAANAASAPAAAVTNPGSDAYAWNVTQGGDWGLAANWTDTTASAVATTAPGATNAVTISNTGSLAPILNGNGDAASLTATGAIALNGTFDVGALTVGVATPYTPSTLDLLAGAALIAGNAAINDTVLVGAGAGFTVAGTLTLGDNRFFGALSVFNGGRVTAGGLAFDATTVAVDSASAIEIGHAGGAVLGALNVDAGITVSDYFGAIDANLVNNGVISVLGDYYRSPDSISGAVSGSGTLQLGDYAYLTPGGAVAASQTVAFVGTEATLDLTAGANFLAPITEMGVTDEILVAPTITGASFVSGGANTGTLDLTNASGAVVQTLSVSGSLAGNSFLLQPEPFSRATPTINGTPGGTAAIVLAAGTLQSGPPPAPSAGTAGGQGFTWSALGGAWGTAANWGAATTAPGSLDSVALGSGYYGVISGAGNAAAVSETGGDALSGLFNFGSLTLQQFATGYGWLDVVASATLQATNATILSGTLEAVGAGASLLVGGTLTFGSAAATTGGTGSLILADGASGRIAALVLAGNSNVVQATDIAVDPTSTLEIGALGGAAAGVLTVDAGNTLGGGAGFLNRITASVVNNGVIATSSGFGSTIEGMVAGTGTLSIGAGGYLTVIGSINASQTIAFAGAGATLVLTDTAETGLAGPNNAPAAANSTPATIEGFTFGDQIQLGGTVTLASYTATGAGIGTLALSSDGTTVATLTLAGNFSGDAFIATAPTASSNGTGTSTIVLAAACFAEGTHIDTPSGPVAIERLQIGDPVCTHAGGAAAVRWIGFRHVACDRHPRPREVWPVRVAADAFAPGSPRRPLFLSPDHAVFVDGVLIPIRHLIDGAGIRQIEVDAVTYWHVELPQHDVILSEGLPSESFLDTGNRAAFANGGAVTQLQPDFAARVWDADACAPLVVAGPRLERVRAVLRGRPLRRAA